MKNKLILTLLFVVALGFTTMAQSVSIGPRIGATFSKISLSNDNEISNDDIDSNAGLQFGAVSNFKFNEMFSIQPELLYVQKGYKIEEDGSYIKAKFNYMEVPVLAKIAFGSEQFRGFVTGGPTMGYWASGKSSVKLDSFEASEDYEFEDTDNRFELGASFGVGTAFKMGSGELNLDVRYGLGFTGLFETEGNETKARNRVFGISLAYLFSL